MCFNHRATQATGRPVWSHSVFYRYKTVCYFLRGEIFTYSHFTRHIKNNRLFYELTPSNYNKAIRISSTHKYDGCDLVWLAFLRGGLRSIVDDSRLKRKINTRMCPFCVITVYRVGLFGLILRQRGTRAYSLPLPYCFMLLTVRFLAISKKICAYINIYVKNRYKINREKIKMKIYFHFYYSL